jgi:hypothetical protein
LVTPRADEPTAPPAKSRSIELLIVLAVWALALMQVVLAVARGGRWTPDSTWALAFAIGCPAALWAYRRSSGTAG